MAQPRVYSPEEQARYSRQYPGLEWVNGQPYTRAAADGASDTGGVDYLGNQLSTPETNTLRPAELTTRIPWEFFAAQVAAPAIVSGAGALFGAGGAAGGGGAAATTGAGTTLAAPVTLGAPALGSVGGTTLGAGAITAPAAIGGGGAAAGGVGMNWGNLLSQGVQLAGNMSKDRAAGRLSEAELGLEVDRNATNRYTAEQNANNQAIGADVDQRKYADDANDRSRKNAILNALLSGVQDVSFNVPDSIRQYMPQGNTGGLRPSAIVGREEIARLGSEEAMNELLNPLRPGGIDRGDGGSGNRARSRSGSVDPGASEVIASGERSSNRYMPSIRVGSAPDPTAMPQPSMLDKLLNGISMGGAFAEAGMNARAPQLTPTPVGQASVPGRPGAIMSRAGVRF